MSAITNKTFAPWRVNSICGNLNAMSHRTHRQVAIQKRISWGRSMAASCKMMLTILRQNELQIPKDKPGWMDCRIASCRIIEKASDYTSGSWATVIERIRFRLQTPDIRVEYSNRWLMRAYKENSRLQSSSIASPKNTPKPAQSFVQQAQREVRRLRKGNKGPGPGKTCSKWQLCITLSQRRLRLSQSIRDQALRSICKSINSRRS